MTKNEAQEKIAETQRLLNAYYGVLKLEPRREPLRELISTMLSHRTTHNNEEKAYFQMLEKFGDWEGVLKAKFEDLADALAPAQFPGQKAANIQKVLQLIKDQPANKGKISIDFLQKLSTEEAMEWLTSLPGVGLKTASLLLLFNYHKPVMPVDTHVFRVSQRVGILAATDTPEKAHTILLEMLPKDAVALYNYHIHLLWHGQRICTWRKPKCEKCVLNGICNYYREVVKADLEI
ncbi:endonuclease III domain-containing protein [Adhaeribacter soli]|uniref:Endonuclease III n=1 Tax=Adhaeribacter soli TaxID=2607655 RepID=A0A5N1IS15_9BACT|nr:endonuclease III [Adhaeribacter soli]KAA9331126.1 endonuclease III [Adhaeribacter soli]